MNKQAQVLRLEPGQALPLPRRTRASVVLTQGELLLQEPARWLAGTVVLSAPVRLVAPASLPAGSSSSVVAVHSSTVVLQEGSPFATDLLRAAAWLIRRLRRRWQAAPHQLAG